MKRLDVLKCMVIKYHYQETGLRTELSCIQNDMFYGPTVNCKKQIVQVRRNSSVRAYSPAISYDVSCDVRMLVYSSYDVVMYECSCIAAMTL